MIGYLRGVVLEKHPPWLLLDVQGVGYELEVPMTTYERLPDSGGQAELWTHLQVREDGQTLFAFDARRERDFFRNLIRVNGVGPRLALAILSAMTVPDFAYAVQQENVARLVRVPGIGKKTAERLLIEMRDRISPQDYASATGDTAPGVAVGEVEHEAAEALVALGYRPAEAEKAIGRLQLEADSSEELVRAVLREQMA